MFFRTSLSTVWPLDAAYADTLKCTYLFVATGLIVRRFDVLLVVDKYCLSL